jgi:hypothetical protein
MPKWSDDKIAILSLVALAVWLFVCLPLLYLPGGLHLPHEILGAKIGEWLLFTATAGLWFATWQLVRGAERTAERQLRAYIHIPSSTVSNLDSGNGDVTFKLVLENCGQTPAYRVSFFAAQEFAQTGSGVPPLKPATVPSVKNVTLGPGSHYSATISIPAFSQAEIAAMTTGTSLFLHGEIKYEDVFKQPRSTRFCLAKGGSILYPIAGSDMFVASHGNEAD